MQVFPAEPSSRILEQTVYLGDEGNTGQSAGGDSGNTIQLIKVIKLVP